MMKYLEQIGGEIKQVDVIGFHKFIYVGKRYLRTEEIEVIQNELGKHPAGYGVYNIVYASDQTGLYLTEWKCSTTCD